MVLWWFDCLIPTFFFNESILSPKSLTDGNPNFAWICLGTKIYLARLSLHFWMVTTKKKRKKKKYICSPSIFTHKYTKTDSIFKDAADMWVENSVTNYTSKTKEIDQKLAELSFIKACPCILDYHSAHLIWSDPQIFAWIASLKLLLD